MKRFLLFLSFIFLMPFYFYGNEKGFSFSTNKSFVKDNTLDKNEALTSFINEKLLTPEMVFYKTAAKPDPKKVTPTQKSKPKAKTPVKSPKTSLSSKRKAAIAINVTGAGCLLAGAGLMAASLAYSDYIDKNEKDYDKYVTGKNISRGLFYGSTAGLGTGGVCITVSIPLFIEKKSKDVKGKNTKGKKK